MSEVDRDCRQGVGLGYGAGIVGHLFRLRRLGDDVPSPDRERPMSDQSSSDSPYIKKMVGDHLDAYGQASLLLVESVIHGLIAQSVITVSTAVEMVEVALSISRERDDELGEGVLVSSQATVLLQAISSSLSVDLPRDERP